MTEGQVVVDHADGLHECVADRASDELETMVLERLRRHKVRVYQEPVIIFDD